MFLQSYVVAICTFERSKGQAKIIDLRGTGFFIGKSGIFITARHVIEESLNCCHGKHIEVGIVLKGDDGMSSKSNIAPLTRHEFAPAPYDVAIGSAPYSFDSPLKLRRKIIEVWQEVASMGYPISAMAKDADQFRFNLRAHRGYIQRTTEPPDISIGSHPDGFELSFLLGPGMSGCPIFTIPDEIVIGVGVGSFRSETIDDSVVEVSEDGKEFRELRMRIEQHGLAHNLSKLLEWKPAMLGGKSLIELSE